MQTHLSSLQMAILYTSLKDLITRQMDLKLSKMTLRLLPGRPKGIVERTSNIRVAMRILQIF